MTRQELLQQAKPILLNAEMVRAIQDGRKTVTRRCVKFLKGENPKWTGYIKDGLMLYNGKNEPCCKREPYQPGDILYVRETWGDYREFTPGGCGYFLYRADYPEHAATYLGPDGFVCDLPIWHPSIHMPKEAARIFLRVTGVKVERLQDMTKEDCIKEGAETEEYLDMEEYASIVGIMCQTLKDYFGKVVWNSTIKKKDIPLYGWGANPWVWVIEFERLEVD